MSSDGFFDDTFDDDALQQLDAIEAAALTTTQPRPSSSKATPPVSPTRAQDNGSFYDLTLDLDEEALQQLDEIECRQGTRSVAGFSRIMSRDAIQLNLFGEPVPPAAGPSKPRSGMQRTTSSSRNPFGQQAPKTKKWDQTAFAKTGMKQPKGKGKAREDEDDDMEEEAPEFTEFPAPFISRGPPPPMKLVPDLLEAKHWIYPTNRPKRDYQFNIARRCLFDNTIVALPTGLGKTFIAGVVMLNFYRWYPQGKVVFVAPTKPLVAQQIDACHQTCGIPGCDAIELTGAVNKSLRHNAWRDKRVFYMTPQTFVNDLTNENCDPRDIILLVIDEAHRATGNYAYNQIVRYLMAKNPHFRLLALTATPGASPDAVQTLVDGLHISRIEIRDENSLDLKQYLHQKKIEQHIISMTESIVTIQELLSVLIEDNLKPLIQRGLWFFSRDPLKIHPYTAQAKMKELRGEQPWAYGYLSNLQELARAMGYLIEGTMGMCYTYLKSMSDEPLGEAEAKAQKKAKKWRDNPKFQAVMRGLEIEKLGGFPLHPKLDKMNEILVQHFEDPSVDPDTRVMVFVTFREAVDEIVEALNAKQPLIRATRFIGQGTDKRGTKGLAQREQLEVIRRFKAGEFNVLVATAIGEEGLDIGEVDMIACYDSQKTPIRMLQRLGRTGRKRDGVVHVLLAEGREEDNFEKAKMTYKEVQKTIVRGEQLELYGDVGRLLPDHIKPECLEKEMEIQEYLRDERRTNPPKAAGKKRKRNDDIMRNIPEGAKTSFMSVADLMKGVKKKRKIIPEKDFEEAAEDDDDDKDLELGLAVVAPRRTKSSSAATKSSKKKGGLKKAATMDGSEKKKPRKKATKKKDAVPSRSPTPFSQCVYSDDEDMVIEKGFTSALGLPRQSTPRAPKKKPSKSQRSPSRILSPEPKIPQDVIEITDSEGDVLASERDFEPPSSFFQPSYDNTESTYKEDAYGQEVIPPSPKGDTSMAWLVDDDDDLAFEIVNSSPPVKQHFPLPLSEDVSIEIIEHRPATPPSSGTIASKPPQEHTESSVTLFDSISSTQIGGDPDFSSPIPRPIRRQRTVAAVDVDSPSFTMPPPPQRRLRRKHEPSSPTRADSPLIERTPEVSRKRTKKKKLLVSRRHNPLFDVAADHSGDEISEGSSGEEEMESESDRQFLQELPATQASPSYNQTQVYRQSLFTQAPGKAPTFANRPLRQGAFGHGFRLGASRAVMSSRSPTPEAEEPDEYVYGSFVVADDADISYVDNSTEL
ncbi:P-loop containing nucleoside triphosphate hydrolase protein [Pluteus cervinus]|uniref:P-loop containing nucleoside triphosphate hydrolase protein n=1 Tax=Pluteus cervinus TaxID=181527 RepID=A0ACD3BGI2_9AGAR|nr:P-loop containing nucleoside triphosphate hydrolase protein [Pluteus cervinus]